MPKRLQKQPKRFLAERKPPISSTRHYCFMEKAFLPSSTMTEKDYFAETEGLQMDESNNEVQTKRGYKTWQSMPQVSPSHRFIWLIYAQNQT